MQDPKSTSPSLAQRLLASARRAPAGGGAGWSEGKVAIVVALLLLAGPLLTIGGARLLADRQRAAAARIEADAAPRIAAAEAAEAARAQLGTVLRRRPLGTTIETLARALPADATLVRAERTAQGRLALEIGTSDPDRLRAALRRIPALARLRNTGQRQADAAMIVLLEGIAE